MHHVTFLTRSLSLFMHLVIAMLLLLTAGAVKADAGRLPVSDFTAARMVPPPTIDGKMAPGEWDRALASSGLMTAFDHTLQEAQTTMYLGYDDTNLYFCYKCRRSAAEWKLWKHSRNLDEYDFGEPSIEIWVTPPTLVPETYQNIINTYPAVLAVKNIPSRGYTSLGWTPHWKIAESEDDNYYIIEAAVPTKDFGFDAIKNGDTWQFLLCRTAQGAKSRSQASWSITQGFAEIPQHPAVHFSDALPVAQLLDTISVMTGHYNFPMAVAASKKAAAEVEVTLRFQQGMSPSAADIITKKSLSLKAGERQQFAFAGDTPAGWTSGYFSVTAVTKDGKSVFSQSFPFSVSGFVPSTPVKPASVVLEPVTIKAMYGPATDWLLVKTDIIDYPRRDEVAGGTVKVIDANTNKIIKQGTISAFEKYYSTARVSMQGEKIPVNDFRLLQPVHDKINEVNAENVKLKAQGQPLLPVPKLPEVAPRPVIVECALTGKNGEVLITKTAKINLIHYSAEWMNNSIGISDEVIPPWTPVKMTGNTIAVWNRKQAVNGLGLAQTIENGGVKQLGTSMRLLASINGKTEEVLASAPSVTRQVNASVDFTGSGTATGLKLSARTRTEFDGFTLVNLTITPAAKSTKVDGLTLEITLPESEASHMATTAGGWDAMFGATPAYWNSLQTASGTLVNDFVPYIWLTNSDRGFLWFGDSDKGWITGADRSRPTQELINKNGLVTLLLHFIKVPTELSAPTTLTFGYQAFPSRPLPNGWRAILCDGHPPVPDTKNTYFWADADWAVLWPYYSSPYPWSMEKSRAILDYTPKNSNHRPSVGSIAHSIGRYRDYDNNWFHEMVVDWGVTPGDDSNAEVTESKGPNDFRIYHYQRWVKEAGFRSLYIDENYLGTESNWLTGNAYFLPDGRLQQAYSYIGLRDYYKRMMYMFNQNNVPHPNLWMHISSGTAYHSWFGDVFFEGENVEPTNPQYDYIEVLPAVRMRAIGSSVCSGGVMTMMCQSERHRSQWYVKHTHQFVGWVQAHDILPEQIVYYPTLMEEGRLYQDDVVFQPYWKADSPCRTATKDCMVSTHKTAGHAMLWVINTARADLTVDVTVDYAKLGLTAGRVIAVNGETGELIPLTNKGFKVPVLQRDFVAVQLSATDQPGSSDTFVATFAKGTRADMSVGCNLFELERATAGAQVERCPGSKGMALNSAHGVSCWSHLNLTDKEGRVRFNGLVSDVATGAILRIGPLTLSLSGGNKPATTLQCPNVPANGRMDFAKLTAGWHAFDLSWKAGTATLLIDGQPAATISVGTLGISSGSIGNAITKSSPVLFGSNGGVLPAIEEVRLSQKAK